MSKAEQEEHEKRSEAAKKAAETRARNKEAEETEPTGPTLTPEEPREVEPQTVAEAGQPEPNPNTVDDGVEDIDLGPPVLGQFVQIKDGGDYDSHFAVYLGNVDLKNDGTPKTVQVRTRDADNVLLDVAYKDVVSTTYSGGR